MVKWCTVQLAETPNQSHGLNLIILKSCYSPLSAKVAHLTSRRLFPKGLSGGESKFEFVVWELGMKVEKLNITLIRNLNSQLSIWNHFNNKTVVCVPTPGKYRLHSFWPLTTQVTVHSWVHSCNYKSVQLKTSKIVFSRKSNTII